MQKINKRQLKPGMRVHCRIYGHLVECEILKVDRYAVDVQRIKDGNCFRVCAFEMGN